MRDTDIFASLLGLNNDWTVSSVDLCAENESVKILVEFTGSACCPECHQVRPLHDHSEERSWRHLDTMQFMTFLVCRVPRIDCPEHGVKQIEVPWAGPKSRFTALFECLALQLLQMTKCQFRAAKILRLNPGQIYDMMHRAVQRGLARREVGLVEHVSLDEKSFHRGQVYGSVLCDVIGKRVLNVGLGRDEAAARALFASLEHPELVKTLTIDMHQGYKLAASELPNADVIHDRFHISANLNMAVDDVRKADQKQNPQLKGSRFVWLKNPENCTLKQKIMFQSLFSLELKTAKAYALKQMFRYFFEKPTVEEAAVFFVNWMKEVKKASLMPVTRVAKALLKNAPGLFNYIKHKLTNGYAEAVNALIQEIKTIARGFRMFHNFRIAILFFLGKLDLYPRKSS